MKKILEKLTRTIDRTISASMGKQLLFFLIIVVVVFLVFLALRLFLFDPSSPDEDFSVRFWDTVLNYLDQGAEFEQDSNAERVLILFLNL